MVPLIGPNGSLNQPATRVLSEAWKSTLPAVYESSSCFTSLHFLLSSYWPSTYHKVRDPSPPIDPAPPSLPFHPAPYPAVKPFSFLKPGSSNFPSLLAPGVQYLACPHFHHPCDVSLHPLSHGVQPCCLPLMAKILEWDISSPVFLLLPCSFIQQVSVLSLSTLGRAGSTVNETARPCSHEAYSQVGKRGINHYQVLMEGAATAQQHRPVPFCPHTPANVCSSSGAQLTSHLICAAFSMLYLKTLWPTGPTEALGVTASHRGWNLRAETRLHSLLCCLLAGTEPSTSAVL